MSIPEKWAIKNCSEVGEWFDEMKGGKTYRHNCLLEYLHSRNYADIEIIDKENPKQAYSSYADPYIRKGFTEITLEQFRKYITGLKEIPSVENYEYLIPILKKYNVI